MLIIHWNFSSLKWIVLNIFQNCSDRHICFNSSSAHSSPLPSLSPCLFLYSSVCQLFSQSEATQMKFLTSYAEVHRIGSLTWSEPALHSSQREEKFGFPSADLRNGSVSRFLCGWIRREQGRQALTQGGYCQNKHIGTLARLFSPLSAPVVSPPLPFRHFLSCMRQTQQRDTYCTRNALTEEQWRHEAGEARNLKKSQIPLSWQ